MKHIRIVFLIVLFLILMSNCGLSVLAMETGFLTEPLSDNEEKSFLENWDISISHFEPAMEPIECFDVNEEGVIVLGFGDSEKKIVGIYNLDGDFQYSYEFNCSGNFGLEWVENELVIYLVRSDLAVTVNSEGEIKSVLEIKNTAENNSYWHNTVFSTKRVIGDCQYVIKNDMGIFNIPASSYSQLITIDGKGKISIIYDVNSSQLLKSIVMFVGVIIFAGIIILSVIKEFIKVYQKNSHDNG